MELALILKDDEFDLISSKKKKYNLNPQKQNAVIFIQKNMFGNI